MIIHYCSPPLTFLQVRCQQLPVPRHSVLALIPPTNLGIFCKLNWKLFPRNHRSRKYGKPVALRAQSVVRRNRQPWRSQARPFAWDSMQSNGALPRSCASLAVGVPRLSPFDLAQARDILAGKRARADGPGGAEMHSGKRPCSGGPSPAWKSNMGSPRAAEWGTGSFLRPQGTGSFLGVRWSRKKNKWRVRIKANGKVMHVPRRAVSPATCALEFPSAHLVVLFTPCTPLCAHMPAFVRQPRTSTLASTRIKWPPPWRTTRPYVGTTRTTPIPDLISLARLTGARALSGARWQQAWPLVQQQRQRRAFRHGGRS